ncbi:ANK-REP-region domain-containing protein [Favolaschia claudopus]|uniref:ANK-REP-region domain-containing protein n=1 Tax=Favolaschia claudopus TaxID=2862362 RepID=A0AAW0BDT2_9AGAR
MKDYLSELPPELILVLSPSLSTASLNALISTSRRTHEILQPELECRLTPKLGQELLLWASDSKPHIVAKLLSPPHSIHPSPGNGWYDKTALHVAAKARNLEIAKMLLDAGANPGASWDQEDYQPLHLAALNRDLEMMKLLLDHGAPLDDNFGCDGPSQNALHHACSLGDMEMIKLLLERGADLEGGGHYGAPLGFAVHRRRLEVVKFLLEKGANANVTVPLFILMVGGPPLPHAATLLYIALDLRHPKSDRHGRRRQRLRLQSTAEPKTPVRWEGLPLGDTQKELMAVLMAHGATKDGVMATITQHLKPLAEAALYSEAEYLQVIEGMFKEAEEAILEQSHYAAS